MSKTMPLLVALLLLPRPAMAEDWSGADKAIHFSVSLAMSAGIYGGLWAVGEESTVIRASTASVVAFLPGLFKELYDAGQPGNSFSGADMFYNVLGIAVGCAIMLTIDLLARPPASRSKLQAKAGLRPKLSAAISSEGWRF